MSRIGRLPVEIPAGVEVTVAENNVVTVKGPKGTLTESLPVEMDIKVENNQVVVTRPNDLKKMKSLHGLTRTLVANMVTGVTKGYEEIPSWIMQGYGSMAGEAAEQLREVEVNRPTHVFVQAGVGSLAGGVVGYFANLYPNNPPKFIVMEAGAADCLYKGAEAGDGEPRIVGGDLQTIMAGLACGEPNTIGWDILRNHVSAFISCPDWVSAKGMRMLAAPVKGDPSVTSGESGAVGMRVISSIMTDDAYKELREALELDNSSQVLMFSTEGDTDPDKYKKIVWGGEYPTV